MDKNLIIRLQSTYLFNSLKEQQLEILFEGAQTKEYDAGDVLCKEFALADSLFIVVSGEAAIQKRDPVKGEAKRLRTAGEGSILGEIAFLCEPKERSAEIVAAGPAEIVELKYERMLAAFKKDPRIETAIYRAWATNLAERVKELSDAMYVFGKSIRK
jgi:CRP-like cAMP-binding protein